MAIWVDVPIWPAHGRQWAHVISDRSLDELHAFAAHAGIPRRSFEGDHYDIPADRHTDVLSAGATSTTGTDLARRLARSGLRFRKRRGELPLGRYADGLSAVGCPHVLDVVASHLEPPSTSGATVVLVGDGERLVLVRSVSRDSYAPPGGKREVGETLRDSAVRELAEETGLLVDPAQLETIGYERITIDVGLARPPWDDGDNHIAVFAVQVPAGTAVAPAADDVDQARWVEAELAREHCGDQPWWPLVQRWLER